MMRYDAPLPTADHDAVWLEHYGDDGALQFICEANETAAIMVAAGWAHLEKCPVCGDDITLSTEEA